MKKVVFFIASFMLVAVVSVSAQEVSKAEAVAVNETEVAATVAQEKTKITKDELPQPVKTTLAGEDFKGWEVANAYVLKDKNQYEVELKNGAETKTFKFDAEGKVVIE